MTKEKEIEEQMKFMWWIHSDEIKKEETCFSPRILTDKTEVREGMTEIFNKGFQQGKSSRDKEELEWLEITFIDLRAVRTKVAGLLMFQLRIENRIKELQQKIKSQ